MSKFDNKITIITGGASGIGEAIGKLMASLGAIIIVTDIDGDKAEQVAKEMNASGGKAEAVRLDVTDAEAFTKVAEDVVKKHERIDYLFNNAGIAVLGEVHEMSLAQWYKMLDVNIRGVVHGIHAVYPIMIKQGFGHIASTASLAGLAAAPNLGGYAGTKHFVVGLSKSMRIEAKDKGVKVSAICPGIIKTPIIDAMDIINEEKLSLKRSDIEKQLIKPCPVDKCAKVIIKGVKRNKAIITVTGHAWWISRMERFFPWLNEWVGHKIFRQSRRVFGKT